MAVSQRKSEYLGLKDIDVLVRDTSFESEYFNVVDCPSVLTQGKSSFLISGGERLKPGVDIKMELVNNQTQETIYLEPIKGHLEGSARRVAIEVYESVTPGAHTLYILGELNPDWYLQNIGEEIPSEWRNIYNVRWTKSISVNAAAVNTQPIFFYKQPSIKVSEVFKEFVQVPSSSAIPIYLTGSGVPREGLSNIVPSEVSSEDGFVESSYPELDFQNKAKEAIVEENKALTKLRGTGGALGAKGKLVQTMSPVPDDYLITVNGSLVDSLYVGNTFQINNPEVDDSKFRLETYHSVPTVYSSSIMRVLDNKTFVPKDLFYVNDNRTTPPTLVPAPFKETWPISSSYFNLGTQATSSINFFSFADITVGDLKTFSGDVHKFKIYAKSEGSLGDFELVYDSPLESTQILYDKNEATLLNNIGYFLDVARINKYWDIYEGKNGNGGSGTLAYDSNYKIDSMKISGSNYGVDESIRVEHTDLVDFVKGTLYSFKAKIYGIKSPKLKNDGTEEAQASFQVFTFGNAFDGDTSEGSHWGFEKLNMPDIPDGLTEYDFGTVEGNFIASHTGTGRIQFKIDSGIWYVSDISVKTATDTAFNPESARVTAPLPPFKDRPDRMRFLVEFYDVNNNIADSVVFSEPVTFQGSNINIAGTDNILSGSMFIGDALASGVEMAGVNSAYIRSMGYQGFRSGSGYGNNPGTGDYSGFMFFSGSVLPDSGDDYKGVGLELVGHSGSYFRFRTSPSILDIRTDKFFIGQESLQYISGSDGNIEISSSLFHLDPKNDLLVIGADAVINADLTVNNIRTPATIGGSPSTFANASASITSEGNVVFRSGSFAGWKIFGNKLSGSNATLDADGAALYMSTKGPNTDNSAAFDILRDEYYIDFTPADQGNDRNYYVKFGPNFAVDSTGTLIASGAVFEGKITSSAGLIGGAQIESTSLAYPPHWRISSSANVEDPASFISSSQFKVSAGGLVTGSAILLGDKGGGNYLQFIDDTLTVEGDITVNSIKTPATIAGVASTTANASSSIDSQGFAKFVSASIGGFEVSSTQINSSNDNLTLKSSGEITGSQVLFTGGKIAGFDFNSSYISKAISGSAAYQDFTRVYMSSVNDNTQNITEGFTVYRKDEDINDGDVKVVRVGGLSDTTNLHANNDYGLQVLQKDSNNNYSNIMYIGSNSQEISSFYINPIAIHSSDKSLVLSGSGQITGSQVLFTGGKIAAWQISGNNISSVGDGGIRLNGNGDNAEISINSHTFGNEGIQMGYNSGSPRFYAGDGSQNFIKYDTSNGVSVKTTRFELDATNIEISSQHASMSLGEGNILLDGANGKILVGATSTKRIDIFGNNSKGYIATGKSSVSDTTEGFWFANNNANPEFHIGDATDFIKLQHGNLDIASQKLEVSASTIQLSTAHSSMSLGHTIANPRGKIIVEGVGTPTFRMGPDAHFISLTTGSGIYMDGDGNFRFGDADGGILFENGSFAITGSDVDLNITDLNISATGFKLSSPHASMSLGTSQEIYMKGGNNSPYIAIQPAVALVDRNYGEAGFFVGVQGGTTPKFSLVGTGGHVKFDGSGIDIDTQTFELDANDGDLQISSTQKSMSLNDQTVVLDGANAKIVVGSANKVTIQGGATDNFMTMGSKTSFTHFDQSTAGIIVGMDSSVPKMELVGSATNYLSFDGSNFDIKLSEGLELDATNIELSSTQASMSLGEGKIKMVGASTSFIQIGAANSITLKDDGTDRFMSIGKTSFSHFDQSTAGFIVGTDSGTTKFELAGSATNYLSFDGSNFDIKLSQGLELDASNIELSSTQASMSLGEGKIKLVGASTSFIQIGASNPITLKDDGSDSFLVMGSKTSFSHYDKSTVGLILGMDSAVPKFELAKDSKDYIRWDSTDGLDIKTRNMEVSASNIQISSTNASMSIGDPDSSGGAIVLHADGTDKMLKFGSKTTFDQNSTAGLIMGMDGTNPEFDYTVSSTQYIRMTPSGIDIKTPSFVLDTDRLDIDSDNSRIDVYDDSGGNDGSDLRVRIGEVDPTTANHYGMVVYDGTGSGSADELVHFSDAKNQIASWSLSPNQISSQNLILDSSGTIQTSDFTSGVKGWRITSANNGEAEFEKITVRGTLATTVFEKESVNAVGGQLYVANSTIYTGSAQLSATDTTMSVANVGGFTQGEIISAKKISDSGFQTEYMFINSASRDNPSSETDLSGKLYIVRGYSGSLPGTHDTGSLGDAAQSSQTYESGQVIVSTGKVGTGFIRLNANPNDTTTPFIDIVERTGSAIYDISLKARLGDLSGLSSGLLYGETNPGFGLFTENVFLSGGITATTGSITGKLHIRTDALNQLIMGTNVQSTNDGIYLNDNNYWYTNDKFRIGDTNYYLQWDSSNITIVPQTFELSAGSGDIQISSTQKSMSLGDGDILLHSPNSSISTMRLGSTTTKAIFMTGSSTVGAIRSGKTSAADTTEGFWLANNNADAEFVVGDATDFIKFDDNALSIETRAFELDANSGDLVLSSTHKSMSLGDNRIKLVGQSSPYIQVGLTNSITIKTDGTDQFMTMGSKTSFSHEGSGTAGILIGMDSSNPQAEFVKDSSNYFIFDDGVDIKTLKFELDASNLELSSTHASMSLGEGKLVLQGSSTPFITLNSGSANDIKLKTDGTDAFMTMGSKNSFSDEGKDTAGILIGMDSNNPQAEFVKNSSNYFIFDDGVDIKTDTFQLDAGPADLQISSTQKSMSIANGAIELAYSASNQAYFKLGSTGGQGIEMTGSNYGGTIRSGKRNIDDTDSGFFLNNSAGTSQFHVGDSTDALKFNGSKFEITSSHLDVSGEDVTFDIQNFELDATDLEISSTNKSASFGYNSSTAGGITIVGGSTSTIGFGTKGNYPLQLSSDGTDDFLRIGSQTFGGTQGGVILGSDNDVYKLELYRNGNNYLKFATDDNGLDVRANKIRLATPGMLLIGTDSTAGNNKLALGGASGSMSKTAGEGVYLDGDGNFRAGTATSGNSYLYFDADGNNLQIRTDDLVIDTNKIDITTEHGGMVSLGGASGSLSNLSSNGIFLSGSGEFNLQKDSNNYLRLDGSSFDIRSENFDLLTSTQHISSSNGGTIAMGPTIPTDLSSDGIFLSGSGDFNLQGDSNNFIRREGTDLTVRAGKFDLDTTTLVMNSFANSGKIALGTPTAPTSVSHTTTAGIYMDGTGDFLVRGDDSNYIKMYSNSIDIKSEVFGLKTSTMIISSSLNNGTIRFGSSLGPSSVTANTAGIYMDGNGDFQIYGDADNYFRFDISDQLKIAAETFDLKTPNLRVSSSVGGTISMGETPPTSATSGTGFFASGSGKEFLVGNSSGNRIQYSDNAIVLQSNTFSLNATTLIIDSAANNGKIALGASPNSSVTGTNKGIYMDGQGDFLAYGDAKNFIKFDASATSIDLKSDTFGLGTSTMIISSSVNNGTIRLGSGGGPLTHNTDAAGIYMDGQGRFQVYGDSDNYLRWDGSDFTIKGDLTVDNIMTPSTIGGSSSTISNASASITAQGFALFKSASIGGFHVSDSQINDTDSNLILKSNGQISASAIQATGGTVGGWTLSANQLSANNIKINAASGYIEAGDLNNVSDISDTSVGFFANKDGEVLIKAGTSANKNYMQFKDGTLDINTDKAHISGSSITLKSPDFYLGDSSNYISGSGGNFEVSSSGFNLNAGSGKLQLESSTPSLTLNHSDAFLRVGTVTSVDSGSTNRGIYMEGDGDVLFKGSSVAGEQYLKFTSSGLELNTGALRFTTDGQIESDQYLIERTRLFGAGNDGDIVLGVDDCTVTNGSGSAVRVNSSTIENEQNVVVCSRSGDEWTMQTDWYTNNLTIHDIDDNDNPNYLNTNGYRLFVKHTLIIGSEATIRNNGSNGSNGSGATGGNGGAGAPGGTLGPGSDGVMGGKGGSTAVGTPSALVTDGSGGGGAGGSGGIILISARTIDNQGAIRSNGGNGANGVNSTTAV